MGITVRYMAQLKAAAGTGEEQVEIETPCSVEQVLLQLIEHHGDDFGKLLRDGKGAFQRTLLACVGDVQVSLADADAVKEGDEVTLLTPISGG